ncbi:MAG: HAMP domain-containing sensor histidine kinase [Lacisediminihabitans sp.]
MTFLRRMTARLQRALGIVGPRWSLRRRLVLVVVGLLTAVAIVIGAVSVIVLQSSLMSRLDQQLSQANGRSQNGFGPPGALQSWLLSQDLSRESLQLTFNRQAPDTVIGVVSGRSVVGLQKDKSGTPQPLTAAESRPLAKVPATGQATTVTLGGSLGDFRAVTVEYNGGVRVVTALPLADVEATVVRLTLYIALVTLLGLLAAVFLGAWIVRVTLRPLERVVATATRVAELPLDRGEVALAVRVPESDADPRTEVGQVGAAINRMLGHVASALTARQASERKVRQFVADASHELRTPLASIRGYSELTRRGGYELPDDVVHAMGRIESEAIRMTSLVEDLLLLARLDAGRDLDRKPVDMSRILIDAVGDAHAAGPDHEWLLDLSDEPVTVLGDASRLHQAVANLLANARIHTPASTRVRVSLGTARESTDDGSSDRAILTVTDDGPGIPEELQPLLFERFARGDGSRSRAAGSTGLGLAIVHAVVAGHGGAVTVESEPGRTEFRVELPCAHAEDRTGKSDLPNGHPGE